MVLLWNMFLTKDVCSDVPLLALKFLKEWKILKILREKYAHMMF